MKIFSKLIVSLACCSALVVASDVYLSDNTKLPDLKMKNTGLTFEEIKGYQNYNIVATHFRKDKNELRYILANPVAYNALRAGEKIMPDGSKVVKIGWNVKDMKNWTPAFEADKIQRVEYMIKDKTKHTESDGWGYARFLKKDGEYKPWGGDPKSCVACHAVEKENDALFTRFQKMF